VDECHERKEINCTGHSNEHMMVKLSKKEHYWLTKLVALEVSQSLISWLKAAAKPNMRDYVMNKATKQVSVMEEKGNKLYWSLKCAHDGEVMNKEHHWLTKEVALEVSHPLISPLKTVASANIPSYMMYEATKY
jgi:hypothetical protein